jgi:hypothetical protein
VNRVNRRVDIGEISHRTPDLYYSCTYSVVSAVSNPSQKCLITVHTNPNKINHKIKERCNDIERQNLFSKIKEEFTNILQ